MSLLSLASSGLSGFASNINNSIVNSISSVSNFVNGLTNTANSIKGLLGGDFSSTLSTGANGFSASSAGNLRGSGDKRENTIESYLAHFSNGIMKSSRFRVEFNLPSGVSPSDGSGAANTKALSSQIKSAETKYNGKGSINVKCHTVTLPMRSISTLEFKSNSVAINIPYMTSYDPITVTFYADNNMDTREYFDLWQSCIMNFGNNTSNFYNEYVSDMKIYIQNESGADAYGVILYECYPLTVGMVDMAYANTNTPLSITITLRFKSWLPLSNTNYQSYNRTF